MSKTNRKGFTLIELLVVVSIIGLLVGILLPALGRAKKNAQQVKDAAQIKEIQRALVNYATNNKEAYPIPSRIDRYNYTENGGQAGTIATNTTLGDTQKNRTGAVLSILIYGGLITPEMTVTPAEADGGIRKDSDFRFGDIQGANGLPSQALWDPGYVGAFCDGDNFIGNPSTDPNSPVDNPTSGVTQVGNNSYALPPLWAYRRSVNYWGLTYDANSPILANRGPAYIVPTTINTNTIYQLQQTPAAEGISSTTLLIHGDKKTWDGNLAWNDGHVSYENGPTAATPGNLRMDYVSNSVNLSVPDNIFMDETFESQNLQSAASSRTNIYLRQWPKGISNTSTTGVAQIDDKATWDGKSATPKWGASQ